MTFEQDMQLKAADAMLEAWGSLRKARRLLLLAGDQDAAEDARKASDAIDVFGQAMFQRAKEAQVQVQVQSLRLVA